MTRVIIESPFAGATPAALARNVRYVRACLRDALLRGEAPFASHALYTLPGVLDDRIPDERQRGMAAGASLIEVFDVTAVYGNLGVSPGMHQGVAVARAQGRVVEQRRLPDGWDRSFCDSCTADTGGRYSLCAACAARLGYTR